uniref:Uncharacterized protein n=1 Tax=Dunaliella tertiolecta TaxID=3047 RepID=A0A7S3VL70_DUNTE
MTLEKGKSYGLEARTQALLDVSRSKMEGPIPHQAPQRERVSMAALPLSKQERRAARRRRQRRWAHMLQPDKRMGVPQLMMLLEPNVVWDHTRAFVQELGVDVEAQYGRGDFLEGWHKAGRLARGVYEGSYWELIGDCEELAEMLRSMSQAPPLMEEAPLELPEQAELPKWDDYKPILQVLPSAPTLPVLRIPPFRAPILETELPFVEPELMVLPDVPEQPHEEPTPQYHPPELIVMDAFEEEEFVPLEPPTIPAAPVAPKFGKPQHGYDWLRMSKEDGRILQDDEAAEDGSWVGAHPFQKDEPLYVAPKLMDLPTWRHPPRPLPKLPLSENLELDEADVELEPIPKLELAWDCGPDPEPAYASISTTPVTMSRATTPAQSRPTSAGPGSYTQPSPHQSRPSSGVPAPPSPPPRPHTPPQTELSQQHVSLARTPSRRSLSSQSSRAPSRPMSAQQQQQQQQQQDPLIREAFSAAASKRPSFSNNGLQGGPSTSDIPKDGGSWRAARQEHMGKESITPRTPGRNTSVNFGEQRPGAVNQSDQPPYNSIPGISTNGVAGFGEDSPTTRPGTSALGLEVLSLLADDDEDSPVNNVLACKELEVQLRHAREEMQEQKSRMDEMNRQMQLQLVDVGNWKDKWIQEGAKSDGIKRECLQIVTKCEQRVTALQQEHLAELSKRDMLLQRSKDTILRLEALLAAQSGQHLDIRLLPHDGALHFEAQGRQSPLQSHPREKALSPEPASGLGMEHTPHASPWKGPQGVCV